MQKNCHILETGNVSFGELTGYPHTQAVRRPRGSRDNRPGTYSIFSRAGHMLLGRASAQLVEYQAAIAHKVVAVPPVMHRRRVRWKIGVEGTLHCSLFCHCQRQHSRSVTN